MAIIEDSNYLIVSGDHDYTPSIDDRKKSKKTRESFISLHEISKGFPLLQTFKFPEVSQSLINISIDQDSGIIIASDMGTESLFLR